MDHPDTNITAMVTVNGGIFYAFDVYTNEVLTLLIHDWPDYARERC